MVIPIGVCDEIKRLARQFIWGHANGRPKMSLVSWDSICQPRNQGGLGFRYLSDQNSFFLMKIGFNLVSQRNALWVRVLRAKYGWKEQFPDSIGKSQCSRLWMSLSKIWPLLRENLAWSIGDCDSARCWTDPWIPGFVKLSRGVLEDYLEIFGPQRVRVFLWLAFKQRLITNSKRTRRGIGSSSSCNFCGHGFEDLAHVLRDCPAVKDVWLLVIPDQLKQRNLFTFQNISWKAEEVVKVSSCWARQYEYHLAKQKAIISSSIPIINPDDTWVFLSTDGAVTRDSGFAASGGVLQDHDGQWILGFTRLLGVCSPFEAEV
ncbi:hypothetical protein J1N35_015585 [Gossypium stocksii]|uniref:Reverse transcriptase zinc-binding domain-containing protein n=1 Tax=Gossypium stocksii TaxID=47602 RepID=A0A9D3VYM5_9ROSI|nr:hypothetical protein J1N35_015585 [Gossypium stocksii]